MDVQCPDGGPQQHQPLADPVPERIPRVDAVCRVCGKEDENNTCIFGDDGRSCELAIKINTHLPVKVADGDGLPSNCCWSCASAIISWHDLVAASVETDRRLRELLVVDAEPPAVRAPSPKVEIEPETVVSHMDTNVVKKEDEGSVGFRDIVVIKIEDEGSINTTSSLDTKIEAWKNNETIDLESLQKSQKPTCEVCGKTFSSNSTLFRHKRTFHKGTVSDVTCNICKKLVTTNSSSTPQKRDLHENAKERTYTCKMCREEFSEKTEYFSHVRGVHSKDIKRIRRPPNELLTKFFCNICDSSYVEKSGLTRHIRTKHPKSSNLPAERANLAKYRLVVDDEVLYECNVCKKRYSKPYSFSVHRLTHISGARPHVCVICGKRYGAKGLLQRHYTESHMTGPFARREGRAAKRFACKVCGAQFRGKFPLAQHLNIHSDSRPYACDVCGKAFRQKSVLSVHKRCHGGLQFSCDVCGRGFRRANYLRAHAEQHARGGAYSCDLCGRGFRLRKALQQHVSNHDPLATYSPDVRPVGKFERSQEES